MKPVFAHLHFDLLAPVYDRFIGRPAVRRLQTLLSLEPGHRLLDAGGGTGRASAGLLPQPRIRVVSDLSLPMLGQAAKQGLYPVAAPVQQLPFADKTFDRVLVVDALHHFGDQPGAVAELIRVLKPRGRLVIEEPDIERFAVRLLAAGEKLAMMQSCFHSPRAIRDMLAAHGATARVAAQGRFRAWIVAEK